MYTIEINGSPVHRTAFFFAAQRWLAGYLERVPAANDLWSMHWTPVSL